MRAPIVKFLISTRTGRLDMLVQQHLDFLVVSILNVGFQTASRSKDMTLGLAARPAVALRGLISRPSSPRPLVAVTWSTCMSSSRCISTVPLVYDLHEPAKPVSSDPNRNSPILFMHGLFGSKKNNRSISRLVCCAFNMPSFSFLFYFPAFFLLLSRSTEWLQVGQY